MKICVNCYRLLLIILCSIFVFGNQIRYGIAPLLYQVNLVYIVALIVLFGKYSHALSGTMFLLWCALIIQMLIVNIVNGCTGSEIFRNFMIMYLPLLLLLFDFSKITIDCESTARMLIKTYNIFCFLQLIIYFTDTIFNGAVIKWFSLNLAPKIEQYIANKDFGLFTYRFTSYLGQSLFVSEVFLIFLILNLYFNKYAKKIIINRYLVYAIAILGVLIAASRTGTFLVAALIVIDGMFEKRKLLSIVIIALLFVAIQYFGVIEVLLGRISAVTLTSGRNEAWGLLKQADALNLHLFYGTGMSTHTFWSSYIGSSRASNAYEYPVRTLLYRIGLLPTVGWCYIMFFRVLKSVIRKCVGGGGAVPFCTNY